MYSNVDKLLTRPTSFGSETGSLAVGEFEASPEVRDFVTSECKVLVVGAGGLGCEILKDLALSGFADIHVIDMDTIDVSNLNRQFLFRAKDVGSPKATTAAAFINARCPKTTVTAHVGKVQEKDGDFYAQFNVVCSGLDNVEARRWLNSMLVSLAEVDDDGNVVDPSQIIPMVDGGTEGFRGQARVIIPRFTSCFECSLDSFPPQKTYPMCTIAETPRLPEHCISYAQLVEWPKAFPDKSVDTDSPEDMTWIFQVAEARAQKFDIEGVTYMKTMGVVKNIIPAVASTNAVVSAVCVNEVFKLMTLCSQSLNTYMMYMGNHGVYTHTFEYKKKDDCPITSARVRTLAVAPTMLLGTLIESMCGPDSDLRLKAPSLTTASQSLYMRKPKALEAATRANLGKPLSELVADDDEITVTDAIFPGDVSLTLKLSFECEEAA
jgi:ubiquitin-activating enzyme E1 C